MRLNTSKCKTLVVQDKQLKPAQSVSLNGQPLEEVPWYKYLGIEINNKLDWNQQWERVHQQIKSVPYLLKRLKFLGFRQELLITAYRSYALSHINYSATVLTSASLSAKHEMKIFQNRCLNIIGIKADDAKNKYNIVAIEKHINTTCVKTLKKMLGNSEHPIAIKLTTTRRTISTFKFSIAIPKTEAYKNSFIQQHIKTIRDEAMPRSKSEKTDMTPIRNKPDTIAIQKPKASCPKCGKIFEVIYGCT